ncbi:MAG TPA: hypothetical protein VK808_10310 [Bacteroidia bacterium]|jgi:hypothetical protein|nr:hypothetical protein [Bacteroidia bacterium]
MKYYSLFFIILFIPQLGCSQDSIVPEEIRNTRPGFLVSIEGGVSSSFGIYHMDGLEEDGWMGGECADNGSAISMNCDYKYKYHKLELLATLGFNHNNYNLSSFINEQAYPIGAPPQAIVSSAIATSYNTGYLMAGVKYPFNLRRFTFYLDFMFGALICHTPSISFTEQYLPNQTYSYGLIDTIPWKVMQPSENGFAFCISFGAGMEYHVSKNLFILITGCIGQAFNKIDVPIISTMPTNNKNLPSENYYSNLQIQLNNLEMGIGYEF